MELTMFERLLHLPLFQGLSIQELSDVMAHVRLDFVNYHRGDEIVTQGEPCRGLIYIINGIIASEYTDARKRFVLLEQLPQVGLLEPYNMFGMYQRYSRTYSFDTDGSTLYIDRRTMLQRLMMHDIVKINLLNIVSNRYQQTLRQLCEAPGNTTKEKIVNFFYTYAASPKGTKEVKIKMTELAGIVQETRLKVSQALNEMQDEGLLSLQRESITIPSLQDLKQPQRNSTTPLIAR